MTDTFKSRSQLYELSEDAGRNATANPTMGDIIAARFSRRSLLKGVLGVAAINTTIGGLALNASPRAMAATGNFGFKELVAPIDDKHHVADGYKADVLIRWGDPVLSGAPAFDIKAQTADAQSKQFGYNNDYLGYFPIEGSNEHGLLGVNHEYTTENLMFPGLSGEQDTKEIMFKDLSK